MQYSNTVITTRLYDAPCGPLLLGSIGGALCLCDWADGCRHGKTLDSVCRFLGAVTSAGSSTVTDAAARQLDEYFAGRRQEFTVLLRPAGTPFRLAVWQSLLAIPYGKTVSYGMQARMLGRPSAVRAVASANGANPLSIFIPCHRVIGAGGTLTGYGGGLDRKDYLLRLESGGSELFL